MPITIKDIARKTKVSHSTVSRALNGSPLISNDTAERIRRAAFDLGYAPSAAARTLKTNRSRALGVLIRAVDDPFFSDILQGIEAVARLNNYSLFISASDHKREHEQDIVQAMVERQVDGIIICSTLVSVEQSRQLGRLGVPIVVINNQAAEEYRYSIYHDDVDGSRQVTHHLLELGHRKIAYLGNLDAGRSSLERLDGFQKELMNANVSISPEYIYQVHGGSAGDGLAAVAHFLDLGDRPTAIFCYNDMMAIGVLRGLQQAGLKVPEDISVSGFDNILFSAFTNPPLTTFDQPKNSIGAEAARLLLGLLQPTGDGVTTLEPEIRRLRGRLVIRESTAAPK